MHLRSLLVFPCPPAGPNPLVTHYFGPEGEEQGTSRCAQIFNPRSLFVGRSAVSFFPRLVVIDPADTQLLVSFLGASESRFVGEYPSGSYFNLGSDSLT